MSSVSTTAGEGARKSFRPASMQVQNTVFLLFLLIVVASGLVTFDLPIAIWHAAAAAIPSGFVVGGGSMTGGTSPNVYYFSEQTMTVS